MPASCANVALSAGPHAVKVENNLSSSPMRISGTKEAAATFSNTFHCSALSCLGSMLFFHGD